MLSIVKTKGIIWMKLDVDVSLSVSIVGPAED